MLSDWLVLGAGSWGTALAIHLAKQGHRVRLWGHERTHVERLNEQRENTQYLPGYPFPPTLSAVFDLKEALSSNPFILVAVPSHAFEKVIHQLRSYTQLDHILWATKGLSSGGKWLHEVVSEAWPHIAMAMLSGPSFAKEVAAGQPTAVTLASTSAIWAEDCQRMLQSDRFRPYTSSDLVGVELGGLVKNVLAIAVGICDGLSYGANARSALITRGLGEMMRLGQAVGAQTTTLMGLSGLGDLILTATDNQSRNRRFGVLLGQGLSQEEALLKVQQVVEGVPAAAQTLALANRFGVEMPITAEVAAVVSGQTTPQEAAKNLLMRPMKSE